MVSQSAQSSGWDDAGMDDEKRGSENDEKEREVQSNTSEDIDEGERWYQDVEKKGVYLKVMVPLSSSHVAEPSFIQPCKKSNMTCDLHLFFCKDAHTVEGKEWAGFYHQLCL